MRWSGCVLTSFLGGCTLLYGPQTADEGDGGAAKHDGSSAVDSEAEPIVYACGPVQESFAPGWGPDWMIAYASTGLPCIREDTVDGEAVAKLAGVEGDDVRFTLQYRDTVSLDTRPVAIPLTVVSHDLEQTTFDFTLAGTTGESFRFRIDGKEQLLRSLPSNNYVDLPPAPFLVRFALTENSIAFQYQPPGSDWLPIGSWNAQGDAEYAYELSFSGAAPDSITVDNLGIADACASD